MRRNLVGLALAILFFLPGVGLAQTPDQAGIVVQFPDGRVETACVTLDDDPITGLDLLSRSGLTVNIDYSSGLGAAICKIGETGCNAPSEPCFCQCLGTPCFYWNYWTLKDGQWNYSPLGAGSRRQSDGDVDGWIWGGGEERPDLISFEQICGSESAAETFDSPLDTPTPAPRPTLVASPSPKATSPASPLPSPTIRLTVTPQPPSSTPTPISKVFIPATSGDTSDSEEDAGADLPALLEQYAGYAGVVAALGFIALFVWRRQKGKGT